MGSDSKGGVQLLQIDEDYEFTAPRFFDFMNEETEEEISRAELWFETSLSYAPSPFMPEIKEGRTVQIDSLCDFGNVEQTQKEPELDGREANAQIKHLASGGENTRQEPVNDMEAKEGEQKGVHNGKISFEFAPCGSRNKPGDKSSTIDTETSSFAFPNLPVPSVDVVPADEDISAKAPEIAVKDPQSMMLKNQRTSVACTPKTQRIPAKDPQSMMLKNQRTSVACTPKTQRIPAKGTMVPTTSKKQTTNTSDNSIRKPSGNTAKSARSKSVIKPAGNTAKNNTMANDISQENQAIKRQKLDHERSRKILNVKNRVLLHKSKPGSAGGTNTFASSVTGCQEDSMMRKEAEPYVSTAEMVKKFQSRTRDIELSHNKSISHESTTSMIHRRPKLTLTRPKEPVLGTAQRVRAVRIKSSAELEEEMLAKIPKFKARPINKKILEAPSLPPLPRSTPELPEFQEFHLKTMERANQHVETSSAVSSSADTSSHNQSKPLRLTEPRPPLLETSLRARPIKIKSSEELEAEELEKIPKFKARPLNKKILESKGDFGLFCNPKHQVTTPQEFHFATNERLGPPQLAVTTEHFDKLSLYSESSSRHDQRDYPRLTIPNPFHLQTEERGLVKERQFSVQILEKYLQEEKARNPKANPYPYTTDYPVIPPKPQPKQCTKPEAFQLESLVRHEEEMQRKLEEKERFEKEEAQRRMFKAHPVLRVDPIPLPERERKPLTDVQEFVLHVDHRAVERSEFDKKIKEKEVMYKRQREEYDTAKLIEEEKAVKQMRRTMVPHAKPLPKFDHPFRPQKSAKETTKPKSPVLRVRAREERRKQNVHMR